MASPAATRDLGLGVVAAPGPDGSLEVSSAALDLEWRPRQGRVAGTAVRFDGTLFEVVNAHLGPDGRRWLLAPWADGEAARVVDQLSAERVAAVAARLTDERRRRAARTGLLWAIPLVGLLPAGIQQRLEREVNFPAAWATVATALAELAGGAFLLFELLAARGGSTLLPPGLLWLAPLGLPLFVEGCVRLAYALTQDAPIGSLLTLPALLLERRPRPRDPRAAHRPEVVLDQADAGVLELATGRSRPDWHEDGVLCYHGRSYRLVDHAPRGGRMVYRFEATADEAAPTLDLAPPPPPPTPATQPAPGILAQTLRIALLSFAPRRFQERWFTAQRISPLVPTLICAFTEAIGGLVNLGDHAGSGPVRLLDLFFLLEGCGRLAVALGTGRAVGSLLGLPLVPLYRRWAGD